MVKVELHPEINQCEVRVDIGLNTVHVVGNGITLQEAKENAVSKWMEYIEEVNACAKYVSVGVIHYEEEN